MDKKTYIDILTKQSEVNNRPYEMALSDFCDYLIELFSTDGYIGGLEGYKDYMREHGLKQPDYLQLAMVWLADVTEAMERGTWLDAFGILYEEMYLSRGKASHTGQFFTPKGISDLMSAVANSKEQDHGKVNDCACGSGRLLLSHYIDKSRTDHSAGRRFEYIAQDKDPLACKMCALNLMAHGMYGRVVCQNTLTLDIQQVVYMINEVKYPFNTPYLSIRQVHPAKE